MALLSKPIHMPNSLLAICKGGNITANDADIVRRHAETVLKNKDYCSITKRNAGTLASQTHFGETCFAQKNVKQWIYALDGKALTRTELQVLPPPTDGRSAWCRIKRYAFYYPRKGSKALDGELGDAIRRWVVKAAEQL
eukprot:721112-Prymnesium_polylepis.1